MTQRTINDPLTGKTFTDDPTRPLDDPPPAPDVSLNGSHEPIDFDALLDDGGYIDPGAIINTWSARAITPLLPIIAEYTGNARRVAIEALVGMVGYLSKDERDALELPLLQTLFKAKSDLDAFFDRCPPPPGLPVFAPYSYLDLLTMPPKQWLISNVLGPGDIGMIYGASGCGKTFNVIDLIVCACMGKRWALRFDMLRPLNVAYCAGEGFSGLPSRFAAAGQHHDAESLPAFTFFKAIPQLFTESSEDIVTVTIQQFVAEWKARQAANQASRLDILVLDTLHTATATADENSAKDMGKVLHACRWASNELGCAVLLVHHTNKAGTGERGSSALRGAMDFMIEIRKISDTGTKAIMHCAKLKDGEAWKDQTFDLTEMGESVRVWWDEPNDGEVGDKRKTETGNEILEVLNSGNGERKFTAKQIADAMGVTQQNVNRVIARLVKKDGTVCRHDEQDKRGAWLFSITTEGKAALNSMPPDIDDLAKMGV